jgi:hypothetical protein
VIPRSLVRASRAAVRGSSGANLEVLRFDVLQSICLTTEGQPHPPGNPAFGGFGSGLLLQLIDKSNPSPTPQSSIWRLWAWAISLTLTLWRLWCVHTSAWKHPPFGGGFGHGLLLSSDSVAIVCASARLHGIDLPPPSPQSSILAAASREACNC